jgi:hypothetical protein
MRKQSGFATFVLVRERYARIQSVYAAFDLANFIALLKIYGFYDRRGRKKSKVKRSH